MNAKETYQRDKVKGRHNTICRILTSFLLLVTLLFSAQQVYSVADSTTTITSTPFMKTIMEQELEQKQQELEATSDESTRKSLQDSIDTLTLDVGQPSVNVVAMREYLLSYLDNLYDSTSLNKGQLTEVVDAVKAVNLRVTGSISPTTISSISSSPASENLKNVYNELLQKIINAKGLRSGSVDELEKQIFNEQMASMPDAIFAGPRDTLQEVVNAYVTDQLTDALNEKQRIGGDDGDYAYRMHIQNVKDLESRKTPVLGDPLRYDVPTSDQIAAYVLYLNAVQDIPAGYENDREQLVSVITPVSSIEDISAQTELITTYNLRKMVTGLQELPNSVVNNSRNPNQQVTETYNELVQNFRDNAELYMLNPEKYATELENIITSFDQTAATLKSIITDKGGWFKKSKKNAVAMDTAVKNLEQNTQFRQLMLDNFQSDAAADDLSEANAEQLQSRALKMLNSEGIDYLEKAQLEQYADIFSQLGEKMTADSPRTEFTIQLGQVLGVEANDTTMQTLSGNQLKDWANTKTDDLVVSAYRTSMGDDVAELVAAVHDAQDALRTNVRTLSNAQVNDFEVKLDSVLDPVRLERISAVPRVSRIC